MWKVWRENNNYIQGDLVSQHSTESAAIKKAKKAIGHKKIVKENKKDEIIIWLDDEDGSPMGVITKTNKGTKRIRQGKKKK